MPRVLHLGGLLLACTAGWAADQNSGPGGVPPRVPPRRPPAANPAFSGRGGVPKGGNARAPKQPIGPPLSNPASPAARLYRATPEERDRALEKLPPKMQERLRTQLERFDALPKPQQEVQIRRAERFAALQPEQKAVITQQLQALNKLPRERHAAIGLALRRLQPMSDEERQKVIDSDDFKSRFSPEEQKMI